MHLLRVQVPDFRGLKNIDITFEKEFVPSIFPLGSQNGGGKSTLLQLIFVLLHCSFDDDKKPFVQNLLEGFKILGEEEKKLAIIDIWDGEKIVKLEFYCKSFFAENYIPKPDFITDENNIIDICYLEKVKEEIDNDDITTPRFTELKLITELKCRFNNPSQEQAKSFLEKISHKIFLAAPATQVFLFLPQKSRELLFKKSSNGDNNYYGILESARSKLQGLFPYHFLAVELLIESFKAARDRDFREAIKTGNYGNSYQSLINDLNLLLGNKRINLNEDFSGVNFKLDNGETIELYPEDLSHGELKRLSIYIWLKSRNIEDAIVLMDEVEIAFHPDWQYQIISDLQEWAPSNQYILATHSYALCEALTPAHVKEIEPKLIKQES